MEACCGPPDDPRRYDDVFDERFARRVARRYRDRGATAVERRLVDFAVDHGLHGATVLEVGGGVGELQLELLDHGAARTVNLELSHEYEQEAQRLIAAAGFGGRVARTVGIDVARHPESVPHADLVLLNRVVCCYPEAQRLLSAAASRADRAIAFSHPRRNWATRLIAALENLMYRAGGRSYRAYIHDPESLCDAIRRAGFEIEAREPGFMWCVVGAVRRT
ncbi:MAG TPA: methyltransferase domain-containing protein [Vicinamibacterales bacterium]